MGSLLRDGACDFVLHLIVAGEPTEGFLHVRDRRSLEDEGAAGFASDGAVLQMFVAERQVHFEIGAVTDVTFTSIVPPCMVTSSCTNARPMPLPSWLRRRAPSMRRKRSKRLGSSSAGMPVPVSWIVSRAPLGSAEMRDADLAIKGGFEGVGEEVENDLLPHVAVYVDGFGERRAIDDELEPGTFNGGAEDAGELGGKDGEVGRS